MIRTTFLRSLILLSILFSTAAFTQGLKYLVYDKDQIPGSAYKERRERLMGEIGTEAAAIFFRTAVVLATAALSPVTVNFKLVMLDAPVVDFASNTNAGTLFVPLVAFTLTEDESVVAVSCATVNVEVGTACK